MHDEGMGCELSIVLYRPAAVLLCRCSLDVQEFLYLQYLIIIFIQCQIRVVENNDNVQSIDPRRATPRVKTKKSGVRRRVEEKLCCAVFAMFIFIFAQGREEGKEGARSTGQPCRLSLPRNICIIKGEESSHHSQSVAVASHSATRDTG